jgi:hypothetical protein
MRSAAAAFNAAHPAMWADVLATEMPAGSSITFYRRLKGGQIRQLEPLLRSTIPQDGVDDLEPGPAYPEQATAEEQQAIDDCLAALRQA